MNAFHSISSWWKRFSRKRRLSMLNATDNVEEWYTHISPAGLLAAFLAFALLLFILILSIVAYTPVLELLPGYRVEAARSRESLMQSVIRLDSMERMMNDMITYNNNIALIMEGKTPVVRTVGKEDSIRTNKTLVVPSREDSLLRAELEGEGPYSLGQSTGSGAARKPIEMVAPIEGIVIERFDIKRENFGIRIAASPDTQIVAADDGVVVMNLWTPETGYLIEIQHSNNLISIYKNLSKSLVAKGQRIKRGGVIGSNTEVLADGGDAKISNSTLEQRQARRSGELYRLLTFVMKQRIALLGSTGSIGIQTLDIVRENPGLFEITTLTAHRNWERLARQAVEFDADSVVIADERQYDALRQALDGTPIKVYAGEEALRQVVQSGQVDVVVNALVGYAGLMPTVAAVEAGKKVALANKETLVAGGCYVMPLAARHKAPIVPIDSEHSAIFQCLTGEKSPVRRLIVTCSGGAFRDRSREELAHVTVEQALKHPQWRMGDKITIDSATLVNKGFEVIEAHWLFGVPAERISVLIHPQSIVHSMVEFGDGAIKAQLGSPDMRTPIAYALSFPQRLDRPVAPFSFAEHPTLTFAEVDRIKYPALDLAYDCLRRGGTAGCTMNGANEVAVAAFLARRCGYLEIVRSIEYALGKSSFAAVPSLGDLGEANAEARCLAAEYLRL